MNVRCLTTCLLLLAMLAGCNSDPKVVKTIKQPDPPPTYPARENVPLDQAARDNAKNEILASLKSGDPVIRANAIEATQDGLGKDGSAQILEALGDPDPLVRFAACMATGTLRIPLAKPKLLEMANDKDASVRVGVRYALHRLGDTHLSHELESLAANPDPSVRGNTALALGLLEEPSALRVLKGMSKDRSVVVRFQVAEARWRLLDLEGAKDLIAGTVSGYPEDQMFCVLALAEPRDTRVAQHIRGKLTDEDLSVALIAARGMGMLGSDVGYGVAMNGVKSPDPRQRALAALAFGDIGRTDAQPMLIGLLKDDQPHVKLAAATAILELKPG